MLQFTLVNEDNRGEIFTITGLKDFEEATVFHTKAGFARGGCVHPDSNESLIVLEGEIKCIVEELAYDMNSGECTYIFKNSPHYFISKTDSVVLEWGPKIAEKGIRHPKYRDIVDEINSREKTP